MAAALFAGRSEGRVDHLAAVSAGLGPSGLQVPDDVTRHRSTTLTAPMVAAADLVVGMSLRHVQEAVLLEPSAWQRTFRLKELTRRGEFVGPRLPGQDVAAWIRAAQGDRQRAALAHVSPADDVADPYGGPPEAYEAAAAELENLTGRLADLLWPRR
jgi:protein-tyrosine phosphatase